jgi:hypothetical protein
MEPESYSLSIRSSSTELPLPPLYPSEPVSNLLVRLLFLASTRPPPVPLSCP